MLSSIHLWPSVIVHGAANNDNACFDSRGTHEAKADGGNCFWVIHSRRCQSLDLGKDPDGDPARQTKRSHAVGAWRDQIYIDPDLQEPATRRRMAWMRLEQSAGSVALGE